MTNDVLDCESVDLFPNEIDSLVLSIYDATISGISELNRSAHKGFQASKWSHPDEKAQELAWWEDQIAVLQYHAGGVGLVSLIMLFEQRVKYFHAMGEARNILQKTSKKSKEPSTKERFLNIEKVLGASPLSVDRLQKLLTARNSLVHHAGALKYEFKNQPCRVDEEFIGEITEGDFRVGISREILIRVADEIKGHAALWFRKLRSRANAQP